MNKNKGFTLIELLVVLLIISILSTLTFSTLQHQRMKARDARRKADFDALRKSLELYYTSNSSYPMPAGEGEFICMEDNIDFQNEIESFISYIPQDPRYDQAYPSGTTSCYYYAAIDGGQDFKIRVILEDKMEWYELYSVGGRNI